MKRNHSLLIWLRIFQIAGAALFVTMSLSGQEARLTGTVTDPSGALVPNARISATQSGRNQTFSVISSTDGRYQFPRLPIGDYQIRVENQGFKTFVQSDVSLTTNADLLLNIVLEVGSVSEQVNVSAEASRVSTESSTIQQLVDSKRIVDLPLNGRDIYQPQTGAGHRTERNQYRRWAIR